MEERYCPQCFESFPPAVDRCPEHDCALVSFADQDLVGKMVDKYKIIGRVGKGGMGVVYKAEQEVLQRIVALKVLNREVVRDKVGVKRFLHEARAMASLRNSHTVTLFDFGATSEGLLYYTMDLLEGEPLSRIIKREAPLDHRRAADLVLQCCESLEEAHDNEILHRDIKPDNLFITKDKKGNEILQVLDFGIAKLKGDPSMESLTKTGMVCGTPEYLSPEQVMGNEPSPSSDLYSLGIVFYEMLAGKPPFKASTPMKALLKHLNEIPEGLSEKNPDVEVPKALEEFILTCLAKSPADRCRSVPEFREALQNALEQHDLAPETATLPPLSTSSAGMRVITDQYDGGGRNEPEPPEAETVELSRVVTPTTAHTPVPAQSESEAGAPGATMEAVAQVRSSGTAWPWFVALGGVVLVVALFFALRPGCERPPPVPDAVADVPDAGLVSNVTPVEEKDVRPDLPPPDVKPDVPLPDVKPDVPPDVKRDAPPGRSDVPPLEPDVTAPQPEVLPVSESSAEVVRDKEATGGNPGTEEEELPDSPGKTDKTKDKPADKQKKKEKRDKSPGKGEKKKPEEVKDKEGGDVGEAAGNSLQPESEPDWSHLRDRLRREEAKLNDAVKRIQDARTGICAKKQTDLGRLSSDLVGQLVRRIVNMPPVFSAAQARTGNCS